MGCDSDWRGADPADRVCAVGGKGRARGWAAGVGVCGDCGGSRAGGLSVGQDDQKGRLVVDPSLEQAGVLLRDRLRPWVRLVVDEVLVSFDHLGAGEGGVAPTFDLDALAFEILVDREEVGDLPEHMGVDLGEVPDVLVAGVAFADTEDLLVVDPLVEHLQNSDGAHLHDAA